MPAYLHLDPDELRRIAGQHDRAAANVRKWGEIPQGWLDDFERMYGTIADPMRGAMEDYYDRRYRRAERQALRHENTRDKLITAARTMEDADTGGADSVSRTGDSFGAASSFGAGAGPVAPSVAGGPNNRETPRGPYSGIPSRSPQVTAGGGDPGRVAESAPLRPTYVAPPSPSGPPPPGLAPPPPARIATPRDETALPARGAVDATPVAGRSDAAIAAGSSGASGGVYPAPMNVGMESGGTGSPVAADIRKPPEPLAEGPFISARGPAESSSRLPPLVVGQSPDEDLTLVRTLLAAVLATVADSAPGTDWAAALMRLPAGPIVALTSTEGRGWLPPGVYLPSEVVIPWRWAARLRSVRQATAALEGGTDPARMLAAFAAPGMKRLRITALASSSTISDELRVTLGDSVALEGQVVAAASCVDFASPGPGLVDRLTLDGSSELLRRAEEVPDKEIRQTVLQLARSADDRVRAAFPVVDGKASAARDHRPKLLAETSPAGEMISMDGGSTDARGMSSAPYTAFERRIEELVWFSTGEPSRQTLRDALYAYGQIVDHPLFSASARKTPVFDDGVPTRTVAAHPVEHHVSTVALNDVNIHLPSSRVSDEPSELTLKGELDGRR